MTSTIDSFLISNLSALQHHLQYKTRTFYHVNMLVITADNHIITQQSGLYPIRRNPESGNYVKDGTTSEHDWVGILPPDERMHVIDPPKGYFVHANNRLSEEDFYGGIMNYTAFTARGDRITELIRTEI
jgi:acyl-homoserine lactone acylase PvdQ